MDEQERQALYEETGLGGEIGENVVAAEPDVGEAERGEQRPGPLIRGTAEGRVVDVSGAVGVARGESTKVTGIAGVVTGTKTKLTGYADVVGARDEVSIEKGAAAVALAGREVELKDHGYVAVAVAPKVEVQEGGRVFITALVAILGGLAIGTGFGLVVIGGIVLLRRSGFFLKTPGEQSFTARAEAQLNRRLQGAIRGALRG
jgi:hypothetical protein